MEVQALDPHDLVGLGKGGVVVAVVEVALPDRVRRHLVVELRRSRVGRVLRVEDRLERLVVDLDELGGVAGQLAGRGGDGDHRFADVADAPDRERVILQVSARRRRDLEERVGLGRDLLAEQRPVDAFQRRRLRDVDPADRSVRIRRAHEMHVRHPVPLDVVDEEPFALDEALVLLPRDVDADEPRRGLLLLDRDRLVGRDGGLAHRPPPFAAAAIASTMFT